MIYCYIITHNLVYQLFVAIGFGVLLLPTEFHIVYYPSLREKHVAKLHGSQNCLRRHFRPKTPLEQNELKTLSEWHPYQILSERVCGALGIGTGGAKKELLRLTRCWFADGPSWD